MDRLNVYEFGQQLLDTNDLDPVYVVLWEASLPRDELRRWLLAYWAFYHVGTACWIADQAVGYWNRFEQAAGSKYWPRSSERRHYRGAQALKSTAWLKQQGLTQLFNGVPASPCPARAVIEYIQTWVGFGPWISFKVADMMERIGLMDVEFDLGTAMYEGSPREACDLLWEQHNPGLVSDREPGGVIKWAVESVLLSPELSRKAAPPRGDRRLGFQEAETILCKWKSYMSGHYHVGEDVEAVHKGLSRFSGCHLSKRMLKAGEKGGLW